MKRSEVFKVIFEAMMKPVPYHNDGGFQLMMSAENVLIALEEAGLMPQNPLGTNFPTSWEKEQND